MPANLVFRRKIWGARDNGIPPRSTPLSTEEHGKRHALHAHMPEAATDWLNPLSLGTMSASAYIENLA